MCCQSLYKETSAAFATPRSTTFAPTSCCGKTNCQHKPMHKHPKASLGLQSAWVCFSYNWLHSPLISLVFIWEKSCASSALRIALHDAISPMFYYTRTSMCVRDWQDLRSLFLGNQFCKFIFHCKNILLRTDLAFQKSDSRTSGEGHKLFTTLAGSVGQRMC